jgi:hypothetical protein
LAGQSLLLQVDPDLDLDALRRTFGFEVVSEEEAGYVIVATTDIQLAAFLAKLDEFTREVTGSGTVASVHEIVGDETQDERLRRLLSDALYAAWPSLADADDYVCDLGISGLGTTAIPKEPRRRANERDAAWQRRHGRWQQTALNVRMAWDDAKDAREAVIRSLVVAYRGEVLKVFDRAAVTETDLPDSFTMRVRVSGAGLRDIVLNYPYLFDVAEWEDTEQPHQVSDSATTVGYAATPLAPPPTAPAVCVIDSGIQEHHRLLAPAIDRESSRCFLPGVPADRVGDYVRPGGHGTRVAGAVLYGDTIPHAGDYPLPFWVQNARVLNDDLIMPRELFPPAVLREVVERYNDGPRRTRVFNHSINGRTACRLRHMSAWAAEIDALSERRDILVVQSAGNLSLDAPAPFHGVRSHLAAGRDYPGYLDEGSCRVANPAQSLQALTVGSVAYGAFEDAGWRSFASERGQPSAFSRAGLGIWDVIKPEVVEFGGDNLRDGGSPPGFSTPSHARPCYPELVRSTMYPPGPAAGRDAVGTSFAAPKVARIAARLQDLLPEENCLLYRALIVQSARWPEWTRAAAPAERLAVLRRIGFGLADLDRATTNTDHRTTLIAAKDPKEPGQDLRIKARECHLFQVPIPEAVRRPGGEFDILIEVTLSYAARPRRTRRTLRHYLSTWVDWKSSNLGEPLERFQARALKDHAHAPTLEEGTTLPWTLRERSDWGHVRGVTRSAGTVQKDWAVVKSNQLPEHFCLAVVGHEGWSTDPDSTARYALAVSFEAVNRDVTVYEPIRVAVERLRAEIETVAEVVT